MAQTPHLRRPLVAAFVILLLIGLAPPAWAQTGTRTSDAFVVLNGPADVPRGSVVGDLVVFHGTSAVDGTVNGSLTAFDAPVTITGRVNGGVTLFRGQLVLRPGAVVNGDVVTATAPVVAPEATITGSMRRLQTNVNFNGFGWASRFVWWFTVSISTLVVGLVAVWLVGRGRDAILRAGRADVGPSIGWGVLVSVGLPILGVLALITVVGIPLGLGILAALWLIYTLGYSATGWIVGRSILTAPTAPVVPFLLGWGILRVLALIPLVGGLAWVLAVVFGLGAIVVAVWRTHAAGQRTVPAAA